jgi:peptidoglycan LD-endopeptidase LytH
MRPLLDTERVPGLLAIGALVGVLLLPILWMARLGVSTLRARASVPAAAQPPQPTSASPGASATPEAQPTPASSLPVAELPSLRIPVRGVRRSAIPASFGDPRGNHRHQGLDIRAPRGTPVLAATDGRVARLSRSSGGGIEIYHFDGGGRFCLYYAHLLRYARRLHEGQDVKRGQVIGYVGSTGNAPERSPHLHFALYRTAGPERCSGEPLDPLPLLQ